MLTTVELMHSEGSFVDLGLHRCGSGWRLRVWSRWADSMTVTIYDAREPSRVVSSLALTRDSEHVWEVESPDFERGRTYSLSVDGPSGVHHAFDPSRALIDPYARGVSRVAGNGLRAEVVEDDFDWGESYQPRIALDQTVIYEMHVKGFSKLNPHVPVELRGTYAGLGHPASIDYLTSLGVTAVELLPVHAFVSEDRLVKLGKVNYWGYNTVGFFAPHSPYASKEAHQQGADAVVREFKTMVKNLHEAGLEVILDVVYNHTAEEGPQGPTSSLRGIDNMSYYRQDAHGNYVDTTGCGNSLYFARKAPQRLVLDSMRYWAEVMQVDGFRLDLAATLGRGEDGDFSPEHPLLTAMLADPVISQSKLIAEPWDVGWGGWQTGNFPAGFGEWNDRYRDRMRDFWLNDLRRERDHGVAGSGIGRFATRLAGSSHTFSLERGPLASVNFITAHDGFTLADLTSFDAKHNEANGEDNRDGSDNNNSYNHGVEGETSDAGVLADRRKSVRNLLGTLLLSAGVPMLTAGDEYGHSQRGNNNAYCQDNDMTWLNWDRSESQHHLHGVTKQLLRLRRENAALRPRAYGRFGETVADATQMDWFNAAGETMSEEQWNSPEQRTLQYLAASTPENGELNRILLIVHAHETHQTVSLAEHEGVSGYERIWDSALETPPPHTDTFIPGQSVRLAPQSMQLFWAF